MYAIIDYTTFKFIKDKKGKTIWFKTGKQADRYIKKNKLKKVYVFLSSRGEFDD